MLNWERLKVLKDVVEAGSFTEAARTLCLTQSAISKQIQKLEDDLGAQLFHRHAKGLTPTNACEIVYQSVRDMANTLEKTQDSLQREQNVIEGPIHVTTTNHFGSTWLVLNLARFLRLYPKIHIELLLSDTYFNLSLREADVAIRFGRSHQPDLWEYRLATTTWHLYASEGYLQHHAAINIPDDLSKHRLVIFGMRAQPPVCDIDWFYDSSRKNAKVPVLSLNSLMGIYHAMLKGVGIGALPDYMVDSKSQLVRILPDYHGPSVDLFYVCPKGLQGVKRMQILLSFLSTALQGK